jgi:hypothetical protein
MRECRHLECTSLNVYFSEKGLKESHTESTRAYFTYNRVWQLVLIFTEKKRKKPKGQNSRKF